jgi:hypothetical protein
MNGFLALAEGFLDRMTNPQYGTEVNEEYSLRFHQVLAEDPGFAASFAGLALDPEDIDSLPICAWPWYLQWRAERAQPPSAEFLDALFEATDDPGVRLAVLQSAFSGDSPSRQDGDNDTRPYGDGQPAPGDPAATSPEARWNPELEERESIRSPWLSSQLTRLTGDRIDSNALPEVVDIATYLLQLGDTANLRALLSRPWAGREALRRAIEGQLAEANLDPETEADWRSQLGLT